MSQKLTISDHSRDIAGLNYVYPVISRRAGGLSVGVNFNTNNACNWRCVYCQVPDLVRGSAPEMDFQLLEQELRFFLNYVLEGDFYQQFEVPEQHRVIKDIAISGNGEPTSLKEFDRAIELIGDIATEMNVFPASNFVLISNGSLIHQSHVQAGLKYLNKFDGEVWFKLDSVTAEGRKKINDCKQSIKKTLENLRLAASLCETKLQTCMLEFLPAEQAERERNAYIQFIKDSEVNIKEVMLYTIARPSLQPEASQLAKMDREAMLQFATLLTEQGYQVNVSL